MSEYRLDRTTGVRVLVAPERGARPMQSGGPPATAGAAQGVDPACPFCPGNEELLADIIEETPSDRPPGWLTRVVPNKYPALRPGMAPAPEDGGAEEASVAPGHGFHEVIIETPRHDADFVTLDDGALQAVLETYRRRYVELMARPNVKAVLVFRNHGKRAGASLPHPHSQVMAVTVTPPRLAATVAWAHAYHSAHGRCATCAELELELGDGQRVVEATDRFAAIVPFAAAAPFEQRIVPRRHQASFAECRDADLHALGQVLRRSLRRLKAAAGDPSYNFVVEPGSSLPADAAVAHWWLRIVPDLVTPAGFELGAGMPIIPSLPEDDAATLRAALSASGEAV